MSNTYINLPRSLSGPASSGSAADGYITFWTDSHTLAGDNDLRFERETNQLLVGDGTSALPSISFNNDPNTGVYRVGSDEMGFVTGSGTRLRINNTAAILPGVRLYDTIGPLNLGTAATTNRALATGDVIVGGKLEVDGQAYFDGNIFLGAASSIFLGSQAASGFRPSADDGLLLFLSPNTGNDNQNLIITSELNRAKDHDHSGASTNPTLFIHSATDPDTDNTQWISLAHDQTVARLETGSGGIVLNPAGDMVYVDGYLQVADWKVEDGYVTGTTTVNGQIGSAAVSTELPNGTTHEIDWALGNFHVIDLQNASGDLTLSMVNPIAGFSYAVKIIQGSTARAVTFAADVLFPDSINPVISVADDAIDIVTFWFDGENYLASAAQNLG